jgi:hypothetical protein
MTIDHTHDPHSSQIRNFTTEQLHEELLKAGPASPMWFGITAEIQRRQLIELNAALGRTASVVTTLSHQIDRLIEVSCQQAKAVESTDHRTDTLVKLTRGLYWLTAALCALALVEVVRAIWPH